MNKYNNIWQLDCLRVLACLAVVLLHTAAPYIYQYGTITNSNWHTANIMDALVRWCVPVFIMISGALNLQPSNDDLYKYWVKRFKKLVPIIVVWSVLYLLYSKVDFKRAIDLFFNGKPYFHLYFLFLIFGLYLFTPFMIKMLSVFDTKVTYSLTTLIMIMTMAGWAVGDRQSNAFTQFVPYIGYYIIGLLLFRQPIDRKVSIFMFVVSLIVIVIGTWLLVKKFGVSTKYSLYFYTYLSITVAPMSLAVFSFFITLKTSFLNTKILQYLAPLTLGVYLIHPIFLENLTKFYAYYNLNTGIAFIDILSLTSFVTSLSFLAIYIGSKIPLIKNIAV